MFGTAWVSQPSFSDKWLGQSSTKWPVSFSGEMRVVCSLKQFLELGKVQACDIYTSHQKAWKVKHHQTVVGSPQNASFHCFCCPLFSRIILHPGPRKPVPCFPLASTRIGTATPNRWRSETGKPLRWFPIWGHLGCKDHSTKPWVVIFDRSLRWFQWEHSGWNRVWDQTTDKSHGIWWVAKTHGIFHFPKRDDLTASEPWLQVFKQEWTFDVYQYRYLYLYISNDLWSMIYRVTSIPYIPSI